MTDYIIDTRRFFRNRFESYVHKTVLEDLRDGSSLTLRDLCRILQNDLEPFSRRYDVDLRKLCGHEYLLWFRQERTYGDVARLLDRKLAGEDGRMPAVGGRWVHAVLKGGPLLQIAP